MDHGHVYSVIDVDDVDNTLNKEPYFPRLVLLQLCWPVQLLAVCAHCGQMQLLMLVHRIRLISKASCYQAALSLRSA